MEAPYDRSHADGMWLEENIARALAEARAAYEAARSPADDALRKIAEEMDQWLRVCFKDSHGNTVYVNCNYYGDGYEYDDLDAGGKPARSPGPPREDD